MSSTTNLPLPPPSRRRLSLADLARRITGFSTPFFGVQWTPPSAERDAVRAFLTFLEDRRALYVPYDLEVFRFVVPSVQEIRHRCTETLAALPEASRAVTPVRAIRAACRQFLEQPRLDMANLPRHLLRSYDTSVFYTSLGELRAIVGLQVGVLALLYEIELESELTTIIPAEDKDD
jgi:Family of unknown function (DUF6650)